MSDKYTAEDYEKDARDVENGCAGIGWKRRAGMLRQAAQMMRECKCKVDGPLKLGHFCYCNEEVSLQSVSGGGSDVGYLGRVRLKINGEFVSYVREREVGGALTDDAVNKAFEAAEKWASENGFVSYMAPTDYIRAALESFAARRAAVPVVGTNEKLLDERHRLMNSFGNGPCADGRVRDRIAEIDAMLAAAPEVTG